MPSWLSAEARAEWRRVVRQLGPAGVLQKVDRAVLAAYCDAVGEVEVFERMIQTVIASLAPGATLPEALMKMVRLKNQGSQRAVRFAQEFGFTPASRVKVHLDLSPKSPSWFEKTYLGDRLPNKARFFRSG
jgi:P27 family predicted phage terminase small subunit